jgi:DegV family protein with EDD domain
MSVAVITDSAAALPADLEQELGVTVVPMWLVIGDTAVREGELTVGELLGDEHVTTTAPTPGDYAEAMRAALGRGASDVLVLTIASTMSASCEAATTAAREVGDRVRVVDTATAAGAQALVVIAAARAASTGASIDACAAVAADVARRVRLTATVPDLAHLVRSGRVPSIAARAGRALGVHPLFEFRAGEVHALRPARGADAARDRIVARFRRDARADHVAHVVVMHALAPDAAESLRRRLTGEPLAESFVGEFGSVMIAHAGPGLLGLAWWWDPVTHPS